MVSQAQMPLRAAMLMLFSTLSFAMMAITIRYASARIPTTEIAFFRNAFGLLVLLPLIIRPGKPLPRTKHRSRYLVRTAIGLVSMLCNFWAISHLPLAQAITLYYSYPLFATILAVLWLHEVVRLRRCLAILAGFVGILVLLRPWSSTFSPALLVALTAAMVNAVVTIQIKQLSHLDPPDTVVFYTYAFWIPLSLLPALWQWHWPQGLEWTWLVATGIFGTIGQVLWTRALRLGDISALQPISFMQLPLVALLGWWLFGERLDRYTVLGASIIIAANAYITHRETLLARRAADNNKMMQKSGR
ncbi:MAG TPA: DMT family transporter [Xylella sp.]